MNHRLRPDCPHSLAPPLPRLLAFPDGLIVKKEGTAPHPWSEQQGAEYDRRTRYDWRERDDLDERKEKPLIIMQRWRIERQSDRWRPPWPMRDPSWACPTSRPEPYFAVRGSSEVGFKLERVGVCHCSWRDYPVSTYVPYRHSKTGAREPLIESSDEDEMSDDGYIRLLLSDGEYREQQSAEELPPEDVERNRDAWGEYLELI